MNVLRLSFRIKKIECASLVKVLVLLAAKVLVFVLLVCKTKIFLGTFSEINVMNLALIW